MIVLLISIVLSFVISLPLFLWALGYWLKKKEYEEIVGAFKRGLNNET